MHRILNINKIFLKLLNSFWYAHEYTHLYVQEYMLRTSRLLTRVLVRLNYLATYSSRYIVDRSEERN